MSLATLPLVNLSTARKTSIGTLGLEIIVEGFEVGVAVSAARPYGIDFLFQFLILKAMVEKFDRLFAYANQGEGRVPHRTRYRPTRFHVIYHTE
jgi:hypothetical protein